MTALSVITLLLVATLLVTAGCYALKRIRARHRKAHLAEQRIRLLRRLLELAYVYGYDPALFLKRFREEMHINHLECCDVLYDEADRRQFDAMRSGRLPITEKDMAMCILLEKGFTAQEISVIYGTRDCNSIYVRHSRIRKKCEEARVEKTSSILRDPNLPSVVAKGSIQNGVVAEDVVPQSVSAKEPIPQNILISNFEY